MPRAYEFLLGDEGKLTRIDDGSAAFIPSVDHSVIRAPHLDAHVLAFPFTVDDADEIKILIRYSCHCWSRGLEDGERPAGTVFMDGKRARVFDPDRYEASLHLPELLRGLPTNRIYVTRSDRNYGVYNARLVNPDGHAYTAYFQLKNRKGRFDGIRHKLELTVESAYAKAQPEPGGKTGFKAVIAKALHGRTVKYRR